MRKISMTIIDSHNSRREEARNKRKLEVKMDPEDTEII